MVQDRNGQWDEVQLRDWSRFSLNWGPHQGISSETSLNLKSWIYSQDEWGILDSSHLHRDNKVVKMSIDFIFWKSLIHTYHVVRKKNFTSRWHHTFEIWDGCITASNDSCLKRMKYENGNSTHLQFILEGYLKTDLNSRQITVVIIAGRCLDAKLF